jgi:hypothetical protein
MTMQNACNLLWALASFRHRPSDAFSMFLQDRIRQSLQQSPAIVHPQNIGDTLQALAALRVPAQLELMQACAVWMRDNQRILLPNHILAYLNVRLLPGGLDI